ncbi:MAG: zinc ribbon domain-containing protein [Deltaproteobacteria bacterium]|nr:zinc ribbon domain-containing protein [Deltaproteobacteria bacterium]
MRRRICTFLLELFAAACVCLLAFPALARDNMSGVWKEKYSETVYSVEQWGTHCGEAPRSTGRRNRKLVFAVEDRGVDLFFKVTSGKATSFSTAACQSKNKGLIAKERNLKDKLFLINCATPETAKAYESGLYSFRIKSKDRIEYRETTRFSRNIKGALCVHTRRIRRVYLRTKEKIPEIAKPEVVDAGTPEVSEKKLPASKEDPCDKPGQAVSLKLATTSAVVAPGDKFCPTFQAFDARGCPTEASLTWGKGRPPRGIKLTTSGCLQITSKAKSGLTIIKLASGKAKTSITLDVQWKVAVRPTGKKPPKTRDAGIKTATPAEIPMADAGTSPPAALDAGVVGTVDAGLKEPADLDKPAQASVQAQSSPSSSTEGLPTWVLPAAIGGGVLLIVIILLIVIKHRRRADKIPVAPPVTASTAQKTVPEPIRPGIEPAATTTTSADKPDTIFCTTCGKAIPAEARFCPYDRSPVYKPSSPTIPSAPICPTCKRLLPAGAKFCPYDKTKLT